MQKEYFTFEILYLGIHVDWPKQSSWHPSSLLSRSPFSLATTFKQTPFELQQDTFLDVRNDTPRVGDEKRVEDT